MNPTLYLKLYNICHIIFVEKNLPENSDRQKSKLIL